MAPRAIDSLRAGDQYLHVKKGMLAAWTLSIVSILVLAVGLVGLQLRPAMAIRSAGSPDLPPPPAAGPDAGGFVALRVVLLALTAITFLALVVSAFSREGRKRLLAMAVFLLALMIAQAILSDVLPKAQAREQEVAPAPAGGLAAPATGTGAVVPFEPRPPGWLLWAAAALSVLLAAAGAVAVLVAVRNRRPRGVGRLAEPSRAAAESLGRGADLRNVILRCYHDMSVVISEELGLDRQGSVTPREFATFLEGWGLPAVPVRELTEVFEEVRYGSAAPSRRSEERALRSLSAIEHFCRTAS